MLGCTRRASLLSAMLGAGLLAGAAHAQELERVEITGSALPRIASPKQASVTSSTASPPKSPQASGPAQVVPFACASRPSCKVVMSL